MTSWSTMGHLYPCIATQNGVVARQHAVAELEGSTEAVSL